MTKNLIDQVAAEIADLETDDPYLALALCARLRDYAEEHVRVLATVLRERGGSWSEIGEALCVSRQAAQQRYGRAV